MSTTTRPVHPTSRAAPRPGGPKALRLHHLAGAALLVCTVSSPAAVVYSGEVWLRNGGTFQGGLGPFSGDTLYVGGSQMASFELNGGSVMRVGEFVVQGGLGATGRQATITGSGTVLQLDGAGTRLHLTGGLLTVSDGGLVDGRFAPCSGGCGHTIGNGAGMEGSMHITGTGSAVQLHGQLMLASPRAWGPPTDSFTLGVPGSISRANVYVEAGGRLSADSLVMGNGPGGGAATGEERSFASMVIDGQGSQLRLNGDLRMGVHAQAQAQLQVINGGQVVVEGPANTLKSINVSQASTGGGGGQASLQLAQGGSLSFAAGTSGMLQVGRGAQAVGSLSLESGAQATGIWYAVAGRDAGANGRIAVSGLGSLLRLDGATNADTQAAAGGSFSATLDVARNGATGTLSIADRGRVELVATEARSGGPTMSVGRDTGSVGTLSVSGAGSTLQLSAASTAPGGGSSEAFNPVLHIGRQGGTGSVTVSGGGAIVVHGGAVSTAAAGRSTVVHVGGFSDNPSLSGGMGQMTITGAGSVLTVSGADPFIGVGRGAGSVGALSVRDGGAVNGQVVHVGRTGGAGTLTMDNARMTLSGQQTGNSLAGAGLSLGAGTGSSGMALLSNGAQIDINNAAGTAAAGMNIGGTATFAGGAGTLIMSGGSRLTVTSPGTLGGISIGRSGTGVAQLSGSHIDVGQGSIVIGREAGSIGSLTLVDNATVNARFVGVGRNIDADGLTSNGGVGSLIINTGSVLTAQTVEIGSAGYLGGTGTIIGNVVNYGTLNPGNSPGTMIIQGNYTAQAGSKLVLEVESDGHGGFLTDQVIFGSGATIDLSQLAVEFKFLGATDPLAFKSSGRFDIDTFLRQQAAPDPVTGQPTLVDLAPSLLQTVVYSASAEAYGIQNFSYSLTAGASNFVTTPVPEPEGWALTLAGLGILGWQARRRRTRV